MSQFLEGNEIIYLGSPYSSPDPEVRLERHEQVCRVAAELMTDPFNMIIYSPIAHTHHISLKKQLPYDFAYWERLDKAMMKACSGMFALLLPGWQESKGLKSEVEFMQESKKSVQFIAWPLFELMMSTECSNRSRLVDCLVAGAMEYYG